mmetsp:Transcript_12943/g.26236  ORF Transcript_12943/g.26236 Transcript_12943/m.26236 type:complete len:587 (-) Transcript_12943:206-1966(-)
MVAATVAFLSLPSALRLPSNSPTSTPFSTLKSQPKPRRITRAVQPHTESNEDWFRVEQPSNNQLDQPVNLSDLDRVARENQGEQVLWGRTITVPPSPAGSIFRLDLGFQVLLENRELERNIRLELGIRHPTAVQAAAIPHLIDGTDCIIKSDTGTGKTLAYLLPILDSIDALETCTQAMIVAPSRELAAQIANDCKLLCSGLKISSALLIGGANPSRQVETMRRAEPQIVIGTPGRIVELMRGRKPTLSVTNLSTIVIDEVDHCLTRAFKEHLEEILGHLPSAVQKILVSATADSEGVGRFSQRWLKEPLLLYVGSRRSMPSNIRHNSLILPRQKKIEAIRKLMYAEPAPQSAVCFVDDQRRVYIVSEKCQGYNMRVAALSGEAGKLERANAINGLRSGKFNLLIATEVAARGLDIPSVSHVFNLDLPTDSDHYLHRAGRCGRAGRPGQVISIATPKTAFVLDKWAKELGISIDPVHIKGNRIVPGPTPQLNRGMPQMGRLDRERDLGQHMLDEKAPVKRKMRESRSGGPSSKFLPPMDVSGTKKQTAQGGTEPLPAVESEVKGPLKRRPRDLNRRAKEERWVGNR